MSGDIVMKYEKPFKTYEEQADLLVARGMVASRDELILRLQDADYYRLSGYWHIFKRSDGLFLEGTSLAKIWELYTFDRQLKLVVFDAIERIEVYLRTQLAYELAGRGGPFGYMQPEALPNLSRSGYDKLIQRCRTAYARSREPFAIHFKSDYSGDELPPYWVLVNLMDFGMVLTLYRGAPNDVRKSIASRFDLKPRVMDSWLVALNTIRNICAHHGRLWNRVLGTKPMIPREKNDPRWHEPFEVRPDKIFSILTILSYMLETAAASSAWRARLFLLLRTRLPDDLRRMGFVKGWESCPIWTKWLSEYAEGYEMKRRGNDD